MEKQVTVTHPINGDLVLGEAHAARLLGMPNNGGWKLKPSPELFAKKEDAGNSGNKGTGHKP